MSRALRSVDNRHMDDTENYLRDRINVLRETVVSLTKEIDKKDVELSRANAMIREQADMLDFLKLKLAKIQAATGISEHDAHLGTTKE